jgi:hypothetical protein
MHAPFAFSGRPLPATKTFCEEFSKHKAATPYGICDIGEFAIHIILSLNEKSAIHFARFQFESDDVSFTLVNQFDRHTN